MNNSTNETVMECVIDCVSEGSSLLDEIEIIVVGVAALIGIAAWGYKKYKAMAADGSISEVKEKVAEAEDVIDEVTEAAENVKAKATKKPGKKKSPVKKND